MKPDIYNPFTGEVHMVRVSRFSIVGCASLLVLSSVSNAMMSAQQLLAPLAKHPVAATATAATLATGTGLAYLVRKGRLPFQAAARKGLADSFVKVGHGVETVTYPFTTFGHAVVFGRWGMQPMALQVKNAAAKTTFASYTIAKDGLSAGAHAVINGAGAVKNLGSSVYGWAVAPYKWATTPVKSIGIAPSAVLKAAPSYVFGKTTNAAVAIKDGSVALKNKVINGWRYMTDWRHFVPARRGVAVPALTAVADAASSVAVLPIPGVRMDESAMAKVRLDESYKATTTKPTDPLAEELKTAEEIAAAAAKID